MNAPLSLASEIDSAALKDADVLHVLQAAVYPNASVEALTLVMNYCKAAGLDPIRKPLQIIQVKDAQTGERRAAVVPGIGLYRTIAARCGCAGVDEPEFGPDVTDTFAGQQITYPSWCRVTVHRRLASGEIAHFTAREFWRENVVFNGEDGASAPNGTWSRRPYGQLAKCAESQALRKAFPEVGAQPVAEELEGKEVGVDSPAPSRAVPAPIAMPRMKAAQASVDSSDVTTPAAAASPPDAPALGTPPVDLFPTQTGPEELASTGELAYVCKRIVRRKLRISAAREKAGLPIADTLDGLTKDQFLRLKEVLA